ncbi:MAG: two-component system, chemotaxis family, chemotaxis protein CheY [Thermoplasmata archaeon]|nr:two-component system, chemotaxis family, chemotaxis protein CheY [Thermoplasmata archaeon]
MSKYLLVDDSPTVRLTLAAAIRNARKGVADIKEAGDAKAALAEFTALRPDVVFLDMMLPGDSGLKVLDKMLQVHPDAKVVLVTGLASTHPDVVQAIANGAFAYLQKPTRTESVRRILNDIETEAGRFSRIR